MKQVLVLGVSEFTRKDGTRAARVFVASTPRGTNIRGLMAAEIEAHPDIASLFKVLPGLYRLDLEIPISSGYGRPNEARPVIIGAEFLADLVPRKAEVKQ